MDPTRNSQPATRNFITNALWQGLAIVSIAVALSLLVNHFRPDEAPLTGGHGAPPSQAGSSGGKAAPDWENTVSIEEARALFFTNGAVFVDARPEEAYRSGHIKGALNLPPDGIDQSLPSVIEQVPPDSLIIAYCDGEDCPLSREAALQLMTKGYSNVDVLVNGWSRWQEAGLPTEK